MTARRWVCRIIGHNWKTTKLSLPRLWVCMTCGRRTHDRP